MLTLTQRQVEIFTKVFSFTSPCASIFIAGGAVADYDKASDIDIWFANSTFESAQRFLRALPHFKETTNFYQGTSHHVVGNGYIPSIPKPIQVIVNYADTAIDVLGDFDLSVHAHAVLSRKLDVVSHKQATLPGEPIRLISCNQGTLGRYIKLCRRYGEIPDKVTLKKLTKSLDINELPDVTIKPVEALEWDIKDIPF
jgi:hypothetical protein